MINFFSFVKMEELKLRVYGMVQGVFFRSECSGKAKELGLFGYVKNLSDGSIEVKAQGEEEKLLELLKWCEQGPCNARVEKIEKEWSLVNEPFKNFEIM